MKLNVKEFQEHVDAMTDDEVRESLRQAGQHDLALTKFQYEFETENGDKGDGVIEARDFEDVVNYISEIAGAFVTSLAIHPLK